MKKHKKRASLKAGLPPGSLIHIGKQKVRTARVSVIEYDDEYFLETEVTDLERLEDHKKSETISWINIDGLHDVNLLEKLGHLFGLHVLSVEDVLNTQHRPKIEDLNNHLFLTFKMLSIEPTLYSLQSEQISLILGDTWLLSFQEQEGDVFDAIRSNLRENRGQTRKKTVDYLMYRLIDTVVDNYFHVTEYFNDKMEDLESRVISDPGENVLQEIQKLKNALLKFRRSVIPFREIVITLQKESTSLIFQDTRRYFRDVYEHIIHISDAIDTQRDWLSGLTELYASGMSNRMNKVMQVLTIIATIFIPLTFIAGIYGMNFDHMPELHWRYGYLAVWAVMILLFILMMFYFKRKKWL